MKKLWICISMMVLLCGCQTTKQEEKKEEHTQANYSDDIHEIQSQSMIGGSGAGNEQGYYYITHLESNEHGDYMNIKYIDYASKKEMYLCNKPNCTHDDDTCPSYLAGGFSGLGQLFLDEEHLYVVHPKEISNKNEDAQLSFSSNLSMQYQVYKMDLDGNNRSITTSLEANEKLQTTCYAQGKYFYAVVEQTQADQGVKKQLIRIDANSGKRENLRSMDDTNLVGTYHNQLVIVKSDYYAHYFDANASVEEMRNLMNASQAELFLFDCDKQTETSILQKPLNEVYEPITAGDYVYYQDVQGTSLRRIHMEDGSDEEFFSQQQHASVWKLDETHLKLEYFDDKEMNASLVRADVLDLTTGNTTPLKFTIEVPHTYVDVLAQTKDSFLVINDYDAVDEYIAYFDVTQTTIQDEHLALVDKHDYYAQIPNYQAIDRGERK